MDQYTLGANAHIDNGVCKRVALLSNVSDMQLSKSDHSLCALCACVMLLSPLQYAYAAVIAQRGCFLSAYGCAALKGLEADTCCCMQTSALPLAAMFGMCAVFLMACAACQRRLAMIVEVEDKQSELSGADVNLLSTVKKSALDV